MLNKLMPGTRLPEEVRWVLRWQLRGVGGFALLMALISGIPSALAVLLGGAAGFVGAWIYVFRGVRRPRKGVIGLADDKQQIAVAYRAQLAAEGWKFVLTFLAFVAIFVGPVRAGLPPLLVLLGYAATSFIYWLALVRVRNENKLTERN